jgi:hypothetical protein
VGVSLLRQEKAVIKSFSFIRGNYIKRKSMIVTVHMTYSGYLNEGHVSPQ